MPEKISSQVALVLDPDFGERLLSLKELMPVWIVDSSLNREVVEKIRSDESSALVTTFPLVGDESLVKACERIVQSLDDHYNEYSQTPSYSELKIIGVSLGEISLKPFLELNFNQFLQTTTGFVAKKAAVHV